jgi:hypothetical protein
MNAIAAAVRESVAADQLAAIALERRAVTCALRSVPPAIAMVLAADLLAMLADLELRLLIEPSTVGVDVAP